MLGLKLNNNIKRGLSQVKCVAISHLPLDGNLDFLRDVANPEANQGTFDHCRGSPYDITSYNELLHMLTLFVIIVALVVYVEAVAVAEAIVATEVVIVLILVVVAVVVGVLIVVLLSLPSLLLSS